MTRRWFWRALAWTSLLSGVFRLGFILGVWAMQHVNVERVPTVSIASWGVWLSLVGVWAGGSMLADQRKRVEVADG